MTDPNTAADIHAHELGDEAELNDARERATHEAVQTLFSNDMGVAVSEDSYMSISEVMDHAGEYGDEPQALRLAVEGDSDDLSLLYKNAAYAMLYPYADYLIANESKPF